MNLWEIYHGEIPGFLREAAETEVMQRLKHVGMNCGCEYTSFPLFQGCGPYSRFDHSMGTALIVWHFTEDRAQAMAGLLHDIATPVFAHVIDFLHGDHMKQESTEEGTRSLIAGSAELQLVLAAYGLTTDTVCDYHMYPVADNDSPKLSADRLEYTLGNLVNYGFAARSQVRDYYQNLLVRPNETGEIELQFRDRETALSFCRGMLQCARVYVSEEDRYAMEMLAELLRDAIHGGVLMENDLHSISFPLISSGIFGGSLSNPAAESAKQCCRAHKKFIEDNPDYDVTVILCAYSSNEMIEAKKMFDSMMQTQIGGAI